MKIILSLEIVKSLRKIAKTWSNFFQTLPTLIGEYMKNSFKWKKELINGKWYSVCDHEHVPMIEHTKDDKYKVRNCNGKAILHESFADAEKLAIETYKKFEKFNKSFEG